MKRFLSILLATAFVFSGITFVPEKTYAAAKPADWYFTGAECTKNTVAASTIDYIQAKHPTGSVYKGSGECYGWAEKISNMLSAKRSTKYYTGLRFNKKNLLAKCKGVRAGTHLRVSDNKKFNGYSGHSIVLLKVTSTTVYWTDANVGGIYNGIRHKSAPIETFLAQYPFKYINAVTKNLAYKAQSSTPLLTIKRAENGRATLYWAKSSSTSKYKVYRATSKNGKYTLVRTTTKANFTDTKASLGKKYYYKVKAIKKNGSKVDSSKKTFTARLATPVLTSFTNENSKGRIKITWNPVKSADKYYVYRACADDKKPTYKKVRSTTKTYFVDTQVTNPNKTYLYKLKAVYTKNTKGNSATSEEYGYYQCTLAAPTLSYTYDASTNTLAFSWSKSAYADKYTLFYSPVGIEFKEPYDCGNVTNTTFDVSWLTPGETYEFHVRALLDEYDYYWGRRGSIASNAIQFTVPAQTEPANPLTETIY